MTVIGPNCATPGCHGSSGLGRFGRFCGDCAERLARITAEIQAEGYNMHKSGVDPHAARRKHVKRPPTCCTPGCFFPRVSPDAFCEGCLSAGAVQELD